MTSFACNIVVPPMLNYHVHCSKIICCDKNWIYCCIKSCNWFFLSVRHVLAKSLPMESFLKEWFGRIANQWKSFPVIFPIHTKVDINFVWVFVWPGTGRERSRQPIWCSKIDICCVNAVPNGAEHAHVLRRNWMRLSVQRPKQERNLCGVQVMFTAFLSFTLTGIFVRSALFLFLRVF